MTVQSLDLVDERSKPTLGPATTDGLFDKIFPTTFKQVGIIFAIYAVLIVCTTAPFGLSYKRFDTRAQECYDENTFYKLKEENDHPHCVPITYPYRLVEPWFGSRFAPWLLYVVHQFGQWYILRQSQLAKERGEVSWAGMNGDPWKPNLYAKQMFALNIGMVLIKFFQSHITYDGLASDVPEWSALYSVAIWILFVMVLEMPRRGLLFGYWRSFDNPCHLGEDLIPFVRKYHGYGISFGTTYNFWYHPMEGSPGFILGYLYQFVMILQSSFLFTPMHRNKYWTLLCELGVIPHSLLIAIFFANGGVGARFMFGFGFSMLFITTQMHGLDLSFGKKLAFFVNYFVLVFIMYTLSSRPYGDIAEIFRVGSSWIFAPMAWVLWSIGSLILLPFRPMVEKNGWLVGAFWFGFYVLQTGYFVYVGPTQA